LAHNEQPLCAVGEGRIRISTTAFAVDENARRAIALAILVLRAAGMDGKGRR